ncbi:MAG TPA: hypothetical protein VF509_02955 [Sphingobium sp.]
MPLRRLGLVDAGQAVTGQTDLEFLPWKDATSAALARYAEQQPSAQDLARVDANQVSPLEYLENPHLTIKSIEREKTLMFGDWMKAIGEALDEETACKVAYQAGLNYGKRRLTTFREGQGLPPGSKTMAMYQDAGHASAGMKQTSALFAKFNDNLVEISRTEDPFDAHTREEQATMKAFFDGFIAGYMEADSALRSVEELMRTLPDGRIEFVHRFWYGDAPY